MSKKYIPTQQTIELITSLFLENKTIIDVSKIIGKSEEIIKRICVDNNIKILFTSKYVASIETIFLIKEMFLQKEPGKDIAKKIGISFNTFKKICIENNIINPKISKKTINDEETLNLIKKLFNEKMSIKSIAKQINSTHKLVKNAYKKLGLSDPKRRRLPAKITNQKYCKRTFNGKDLGCGDLKSILEFRSRPTKNGTLRYSCYCFECEAKIASKHSKKHYDNNRDKIFEREKNRMKIDIFFALRKNISKSINRQLKLQNGSKFSKSCMDYLPYTIEELKQHLEVQFEPWMTWDNHGIYKLGGERKWHIDHIYPQSLLPYTSMEDENFRKSWALSNLRPLEALKNIKKSNKTYA